MRKSVFWKVALVLVGVQVVTGLSAVALSAYFAQERSLELVRGNLILRLDQVAEELETRASFDEEGQMSLPERLGLDLSTRFPDSVHVLDFEGRVLFGGSIQLPDDAEQALALGEIEVAIEGDTWAMAPLLAPDGLPAGALFISPLENTLKEELRGTREAFVRAIWTVAALAAGLAFLLGALFTWRLVKPIRRMTLRVETLGEGNYTDRLPARREDELGRLSSAINDMAERVEASIASLRSTDKLRRELVANVGHDLRTPLAALKGYLEEARRFSSEGRDEDVATALAVAERQSNQMSRLVEDLFELSKLELAAMERSPSLLQHGFVSIAQLVTETIEAHQSRFVEVGVELAISLAEELPTINCDGQRISRVLDNLLSNALRHTPEGGMVTVSAESDETTIRVTIADSGEGIPADELDAVFERYYRGSSARTRSKDGSGSGLGLAISRAIARAHGGDLDVKSEKGEGSSFCLWLPRNGANPGPNR